MVYLANIRSESLLLAERKEFGSAAAGGFYYKVVLCLFKLEFVQSNPLHFSLVIQTVSKIYCV